jgi:hypothetical protein
LHVLQTSDSDGAPLAGAAAAKSRARKSQPSFDFMEDEIFMTEMPTATTDNIPYTKEVRTSRKISGLEVLTSSEDGSTGADLSLSLSLSLNDNTILAADLIQLKKSHFLRRRKPSKSRFTWLLKRQQAKYHSIGGKS